MGAPRVYRTEAVVVRRHNLGEADKIVTLLTPRYGLVRAVAKGIRRPKAKLSGHLDLLCRSELLIAKGQNLDVVTGAALIDGYAPLRDQLYLGSCATYCLEVIERFSEERLENRALYATLVETLEALTSGRNVEMTLRHFDLRVLDVSGYRPELRSCLGCGAAIEPDANRFGPAGATCPNCVADPASAPISVNALKILRFLQGADLASAQRVRVDPKTLREVESHLRRVIRATLERSLKSTDFLDLVRRQDHDAAMDISRL